MKFRLLDCQEILHLSQKSNLDEIQTSRLPGNTPHVTEIKSGWNLRLSSATKYPTSHGNQIQVKSTLLDYHEIPHMSQKSNLDEIQASRLPRNIPHVTEIKSRWNLRLSTARKYSSCHRNQIWVKSWLVDCQETPHMPQKSNALPFKISSVPQCTPCHRNPFWNKSNPLVAPFLFIITIWISPPLHELSSQLKSKSSHTLWNYLT